MSMERLKLAGAALIAMLVLGLSVGVAAASATTTQADTTYVAGAGGLSAGNASDSNDCSMQTTPCATLQGALSQTNDGGTVYVSGTLAAGSATDVAQNVTIAAAPGAGSATIQGTSADANGLLSIGSGLSVSIQGLALNNGRSQVGGAIDVNGSTLTVSGSSFDDDAAIGTGSQVGEGGAIASGDSAGGDAAGSQITITGSTFTDDAATAANGVIAGAGGAIYSNDGSSLTISDSTFTANTASFSGGQQDGNGGAIDVGDADTAGSGTGSNTTVITDSAFTENVATSVNNNGDGGAIDNGDSTSTGTNSLTISGSSFTENTAGGAGGAIDNGEFASGGTDTVSISDSTFDGNSANGAGGDGGAIDDADGCAAGTLLVTVARSTFVGNSAGLDGGTVDNADCGTSTLTIVQSTLTDSSAGGNGSLIDSSDYGGAGTVYTAADVISGSCNQAKGGTWNDEGYNAATDASCLGSSPTNPDATVSAAAGDLGTLADNGGPTETVGLAPDNPALGLIPAGTSISVPASPQDVTVACPVTADQRGVGFGSVGSDACDAGAIQLQTESVSFSSPAPSAVVGGASYTPQASSSAGLPVGIRVDASTTNSACTLSDGVVSFAHAGSCVIDAQAGNTNVADAQAQQTVTVASAGTSTGLVVGTNTLTATVAAPAPGGGTPTGTVVFSVGGSVIGSTSLADGVATLDYTVPADETQAIQATYQGDADYESSSVTATASGASVSFGTSAPSAVVSGASYTPQGSSSLGLPVTIAVDTATTNSACALSNGVISFQHAGSCVIDAQAGTGADFSEAQQTVTVASARTSTSLASAGNSLTATVAASAPSGGTPTGTVVFSVDARVIGSADLANGVATLGYTVPGNETQAILATYQGNDDYDSSSAAISASGATITPASAVKPTITARLTSARPKNKHGWWHTAVTVHFSCSAAGSTIVGGCPSTVRLRRSGSNLSLSRTITTAAGGSATITLRGIKIDLSRPRVGFTGIRGRALYHGLTPPVGCAASDRVSGIASCKVTWHVKHRPGLETITYIARATSWAGVTDAARETIYARP